MPIYEYQCTNCNHQFDLLQKVNDAPVRQCPKCLEDKVIRLISAAAFQLKGTGWYVTDFKNKDNPKKESKSEAKAEPKSEAKPEPKSDSSSGKNETGPSSTSGKKKVSEE